MDELRPLLAIVGLAVVAGAILVAIARARGRFEWWDRFLSPGRPRRSSHRGKGAASRPAGRKAASGPASAGEARSGTGGAKARSGRRNRSRGGRGADRQANLGLEDIPLLDPAKGPHATALDQEFDMGDLSALGKEAGGGAEPGETRPAPPGSGAGPASEERGRPERAAARGGAAAPSGQGAGRGSKPAPEPPPTHRKRTRRQAAPPDARGARAESREAAESGHGGEELLVVLTIMSPGERKLSGAGVRQAFASFDLEPDEDGLFHHFGNRKGASRQPVFSIANVLEPGAFDVGRMDGLETPGLCLFMRRPGPFLATVAFDLMLDVGSRLARTLEAVLCDHQRCRLTVQATQALRERVVHFALRHEREVPVRR